MVARKTVPTVAVCYGSDSETKKIFQPSTPSLFLFFNFYFLFLLLIFLDFFCHVYVDLGHILIIFFLYCFMFTIILIPDIERRKSGLLIGQPQGSLSESRWFGVFKLF